MDLESRAARLAHQIGEKLDIGGQGLEAKLARGGRRLPGHVRAALSEIIAAQAMAQNPKLASRLDHARLEACFAAVEHYLRNVDPWARRREVAADWLAGNVVNILLIAGIIAAVLVWRGFV